MGHQQRNANRAYRIEKNKERIEELARKIEEFGKILQKMKHEMGETLDETAIVVDEVFDETRERLRLIERPLWKKLLKKDLEPPITGSENLDFEKDVLPEIERQTGEIPAEVKEEAKADAMAMAVEGSTPVLGKFVEAVIKEQKEAEMKKKDEEKEKERPATPSHRQVVVDRAVPGPRKKGEPDGTKAESRDN